MSDFELNSFQGFRNSNNSYVFLICGAFEKLTFCTYKHKLLENLRHFEKYRQYIGADCIRSVSLGSCYFRRLWPLIYILPSFHVWSTQLVWIVNCECVQLTMIMMMLNCRANVLQQKGKVKKKTLYFSIRKNWSWCSNYYSLQCQSLFCVSRWHRAPTMFWPWSSTSSMANEIKATDLCWCWNEN